MFEWLTLGGVRAITKGDDLPEKVMSFLKFALITIKSFLLPGRALAVHDDHVPSNIQAGTRALLWLKFVPAH